MRATLLIGVVTVLALGFASFASVSRLAQEKVVANSQAKIQMVEDRVEQRLSTADVVTRNTVAQVASSDRSQLASVTAAAVDQSGGHLVACAVFDRSGNMLASATASGTAPVAPATIAPVFRKALAGNSGYVANVTSGGEWALWDTRTAVGAGGVRVVLTRLDTAFLKRVVLQAVRDSRAQSVVVLDSGRVVAAAGENQPLRLETGVWGPAGSSSGTVRVRSSANKLLEGTYDDMAVLGWRVAIVQPIGTELPDVIRAITPSAVVLLLGGVVAIGVSWSLSSRLVRPLRDLERAARAAAAGSYVKPIATEGGDEIGQVAEAFNAVALRLNALHDLSQLLASASRLDQVLDGILSSMGHIVGPGATAVYLRDDEGGLAVARTRGSDLARAESVDGRTPGWLTQSLEGHDPKTYSGTEADLQRELPGIRGRHRSVMLAPLVAGRDALGVVAVLRDDGAQPSEAELEMVRTFSAQAAVAVQNSRLFEEESESRKIAEALRAAAEQLARPRGIEEALNGVEAIVRDLFRASGAWIALVDRAMLGLPPVPEGRLDTAVLGAALAVLAEGSGGEAMVVPLGENALVDEVLESAAAETLFIVPIGLQTDHGGVLAIALTDEGVDREMRSIAEGLADEIALALDNAYFYERALARAANLETIFRISQAVGSSLQVNVVLNRVLDVVQKILSADAVALLGHDARTGTLATSMARGQVPPGVLHLEVLPGEDLPGHVFATREPVAIHDLHAGMEGVAGAAAAQNLRSLLAVPLLARGRPIGVLMVFSGQPGAFTDEDLSVLQTFAAQAALAIDTARLYSREHEVATVLQQSILPDELPEIEGVSASAVYAPAGNEADIGGDYYDLFRARDGAIWIAIGDVCGKGIHAATKTSMIKYALKGLVAAGEPPASVVGEINRMTSEAGDPSDIFTLWAGRYCPTSGILAWADGGHPPALLRRTDGEVVQLGVTGPLLGAFAQVEYDSGSIRIEPGDTVLLYTDGVTEARKGTTFFGDDRIAEILADEADAGVLPRRLLSAVRGFVSGGLRDDVAILAVSFGADGGVKLPTSEEAQA